MCHSFPDSLTTGIFFLTAAKGRVVSAAGAIAGWEKMLGDGFEGPSPKAYFEPIVWVHRVNDFSHELGLLYGRHKINLDLAAQFSARKHRGVNVNIGLVDANGP